MPLDREGRFTIHELRVRDIDPLSSSLCEMDLRELELLGTKPQDALRHGYLIGNAYVARDGDTPVAAFGVNYTVTPGAIWFFGSKVRFDYPVTFQRLSKRWMKFLCEGKVCGNVVPADHHGTIRWLKSLDFAFNNEVFKFHGHDFLMFMSKPEGPATKSLRH